jgi:hypothetical protein
MPSEETSTYMASIYQDLHRGFRSWEVWKEIWFRLSQQPIGYLEFIEPVQPALLDSVILAISRTLDNDSRTMSIPNLMSTDSTLIGSGLEKEIDQRLTTFGPTLLKIRQRRDQHIAHQDMNKSDPTVPLDVIEIDRFITSLVEDFRKIGVFIYHSDYVFDHDIERTKVETARVMEILQEEWLSY